MEKARGIGRPVLEPQRSADRRLEREQPIVVGVVGLERDAGEVVAQAVDHRDERVVVLVEVVHPGAVEPRHEVELEVADAPVRDGVADARLDVRESRRAPLRQAGFVGSAVRVGLVVGDQPVADRMARPIRVLLERLRGRVEVDGAHPEPQLHRPERTPHGLEVVVWEARREHVPRLTVRRRVRVPVAGRRLPAVVEDERRDAEVAGDRRKRLDRGEVGVVLRAGRDPVRVDVVRVEGDVVGPRLDAVARQVALPLPRGVVGRSAEAGERRLEREALPGAERAGAAAAGRRVLDVDLLFERA